jgi:hypothetical protein
MFSMRTDSSNSGPGEGREGFNHLLILSFTNFVEN